jgi:hypothetical protein
VKLTTLLQLVLKSRKRGFIQYGYSMVTVRIQYGYIISFSDVQLSPSGFHFAFHRLNCNAFTICGKYIHVRI